MAFSQATLNAIQPIASRAETMWHGPKLHAFDFSGLGKLILGFVLNNCKPKTPTAQQAMVQANYKKAIANGVDGVVEAIMPPNRAKKLRKKLAKKKGVTSTQQQDMHVFNFIVAANAERTEAVNALTSAVDNDETEDDDE